MVALKKKAKTILKTKTKFIIFIREIITVLNIMLKYAWNMVWRAHIIAVRRRKANMEYYITILQLINSFQFNCKCYSECFNIHTLKFIHFFMLKYTLDNI